MTDIYATAVRDEVWSHGVRIESRLAHGLARRDGETIFASDRPDSALVACVNERMPPLRALIRELGDARVRLVAEALREQSEERDTATITVTIDGVSIVTAPEHVLEDVVNLRALLALPGGGEMPGSRVADDRGDQGDRGDRGDTGEFLGRVPPAIIWRNGSASVLLHEAIGHASEHGHAAIEWPSWLQVDVPLRMRRASFRDVAMPRMTRLVASQTDAPFEWPGDAVEVHFVAGGWYEPLTEQVTLEIAVATFRGRRIPPFTIARSRREIAASLAGAHGESLRYPGVICSREGQEVVVGSHAPLMVTR